jgi:hypothetical protein
MPLTDNLDRSMYDLMKSRRISTLDLHQALEKAGVVIPQRTLQHHLNHDLKTTDDERIKKAIIHMVKNYDDMIVSLKEKFKLPA